MKRFLLVAIASILSVPQLALASDYMNLEERQGMLCGKTYDVENQMSGWTFTVTVAPTCNTSSVSYKTGKKAGKTEGRILEGSADGKVCAMMPNGKKRCSFAKDMGDGTVHIYAAGGKHKGKHIATLSNIRD